MKRAVVHIGVVKTAFEDVTSKEFSVFPPYITYRPNRDSYPFHETKDKAKTKLKLNAFRS